jgi:hypothetical protein
MIGIMINDSMEQMVKTCFWQLDDRAREQLAFAQDALDLP